MNLSLKAWERGDDLRVRFNGQQLEKGQKEEETLVYAGVPAKRGTNELVILLHEGSGTLRVEGIELLVDFTEKNKHGITL